MFVFEADFWISVVSSKYQRNYLKFQENGFNNDTENLI